MIDTNVYLSRWPFRRLPGDEMELLVKTLRRSGVAQAWAGSFAALLHRDVAAVNLRLAEMCRRHGEGLLMPFGTVNPALPDWEEDLRRCDEQHGMPGIRLHPNYHGYALDHTAFESLLQQAAERGLLVQLALTMEDERTQHPLVQVPHVDTQPLAALMKKLPGLRLQLLGASRSLTVEKIGELAAVKNLYVEFSMLEGVGGIEKLLGRVSLEQVLFGSHFPLFYFESAVMKMQESVLGQFQREAIAHENAKRLLGNLASR